jgi:nucleoside-diphosphate-sugar epimerase
VIGSKCLIVGCGDIGIALAEILEAEDCEVWGLRRDCAALPDSIHSIVADVTRIDTLEPLRSISFDLVLVTLTPGAFNDSAYQEVYVEGLRNLLAVLNPEKLQRVFYVSSTSVYHQCDGGWVDEDSLVRPSNFSGRRLLEAEALLTSSGLATTVIRFAGIYGPGRNRLIEQVSNGQGCSESPPLYTNRIHRDDCVGFLAHLLRLQWQGQALQTCYIGVDNEPVTMWELKQWLAQQLGISPGQLLQESMTRRNSKRCSNRRMLASGYRLLYQGYRQGYGALLHEQGLKPLL